MLEDEQGSQYWLFEGQRAQNMGLNAVAGCPPEEYGLNPLRYDMIAPAVTTSTSGFVT